MVKLELLKSLRYFVDHHPSISFWNRPAVKSVVWSSRIKRASSRLDLQIHPLRHKVAILCLRDSIHGIPGSSRQGRLWLKQLGGSHAASPLRWRGSFGGSFGNSFLPICFPFLYRLYSGPQRLDFGQLHFLPPVVAFVASCIRKPSTPRKGAWRASCPSRVLRIPEGHCQLVVLSVGDERPFMRCFDILPHLPEWCFQLLVRPNAPPCYRVQGSASPEEPSPATFWPVHCLWFDPFLKQIILSLGPLRPGYEVAARPRAMVMHLLCSIYPVCLRHLLTLFRLLMGHKCGPVIFDLLIYAHEFWSRFLSDKRIQFFLPCPELVCHLRKCSRLD